MAAGMFGAMKFALCILTICTAIIISGFPTTNDAADAANPNDDVVDDENPRTAGSSSTLRYVHAIWRHGDRAPLEKPYPGDMHDESFWPRGWGQLTTLGMQQTRELGTFLRRRYVGTFLSTQYNRKEIVVRTTEVDRAIESAQSVLSGMFPPQLNETFEPGLMWQPIAIHSTGKQKMDPLLRPWSFGCDRYKKLLDPIRDASDAKLLADYRDVVDFVRPHLNITAGEPVKMMEVMRLRHIMPEIIHKLPQPEWVFQQWPTRANKTTMELIWEMRRQNWLPDFSGSEEISKLVGGLLMADWFNRTKAATNGGVRKDGGGAGPTKMMLYSAHDKTLLTLLAAFGVEEPLNRFDLPPYASCIIMELHENSASAGNFHVKLFYRRNQRVEQIVLAGCTANCTFTDAIELIQPRAVFGGVQALQNLCQNDDAEAQNSASHSFLNAPHHRNPFLICTLLTVLIACWISMSASATTIHRLY